MQAIILHNKSTIDKVDLIVNGVESITNESLKNPLNTLKFRYKRECIFCVNNKCMDILNKNGNKRCHGNRKCTVSGTCDGWVSHEIKVSENYEQ